MKLELKHLAPYLPYGLKVQYVGITNTKELSEYRSREKKYNNAKYEKGDIWYCFPELYPEEILGLKEGFIKEIGIYQKNTVYWVGTKAKGLKKFYNGGFYPILRPLSDYTDITSKAMSDLNCDLSDQMDIQEFALKKMSLASLSYGSFEVLVRNLVDIFGYIENGLAIDINTLK